MDAKIAGFYTCYDAYFCKIFTYLCKSSLERRIYEEDNEREVDYYDF